MQGPCPGMVPACLVGLQALGCSEACLGSSASLPSATLVQPLASPSASSSAVASAASLSSCVTAAVLRALRCHQDIHGGVIENGFISEHYRRPSLVAAAAAAVAAAAAITAAVEAAAAAVLALLAGEPAAQAPALRDRGCGQLVLTIADHTISTQFHVFAVIRVPCKTYITAL